LSSEEGKISNQTRVQQQQTFTQGPDTRAVEREGNQEFSYEKKIAVVSQQLYFENH